MLRVACGLCLALLAISCSNTPEVASVLDQIVPVDSQEITSDIQTEDMVADSHETRFPDLTASDLPDADLTPGCEAGTGCFLEPCEDGSDCLSGLCVGYMGNLVCTQQCVEECPVGWDCQQLMGLEPDIAFACVSPYSHLCRPCHSTSDCDSAMGEADACISYDAGGNFCGANCSEEQPCPVGYSCSNVQSTEGSELVQCTPDAGICDCSDLAVSLGLTTECYIENDWGTCFGKRTCITDGLSGCDATQPAEEVCNGTDDDCNGVIDDVSCDDGNDCTEDLCTPPDGCTHEPLTGTDCGDDNVCTLADHCEDGSCIGSLIDCDDNDLCTDDGCDPMGGCIYAFNHAGCDDGDPCMVNDSCLDGTCSGFPIPCDCQEDVDCTTLEDEDICNGTLFCDTKQFPQQCAVAPDTIIECAAPEGLGAECLAATCHPITGECSFEPTNNDGLCNDENACTLGETCAEGICIGSIAPNCNDNNPCTTDMCDTQSGCVHEHNSLPCEDGDVCTVNDLCAESECEPGQSLTCNDANQCTKDSCAPATGCFFQNIDGGCDDGNSCTTQDTCIDGKCVGTGSLECDDSNPCTKDICLPMGGCAHENIDASCSDEDACTINDSCSDGLCIPGDMMNCDDSNPCTDDACKDNGICVHEANQELCDDINLCTNNDHCFNGTCIGGESVNCDDSEVCTTEICNPIQGCLHIDNNVPCSDGDICTMGDSCAAGSCQSGPEVSCDDGNPCTDDSCDSQTGCTHLPNDESCDDANHCTVDDTCTSGVCLGLSMKDCNDDNICTDDTCNPLSGCVYEVNTNPCTDQNVCTLNDTCQDGVCVSSENLTCDDGNTCTEDSCDAQKACLHVPAEGNCNDGNVCTLNDTCLNGTCVSNDALVCNDDNICTDDSCSPQSGCLYIPNTVECDDNSVCTLNDICQNSKCVASGFLDCDDSNICTDDSCDEIDGCQNTHNTAPCDDSSVCTLNDTCNNGICGADGMLNCDDGNQCTDDSCDVVDGCLNTPVTPCCGNGIVEAAEGCDDGNILPGDGCDSNCALEPQVSCLALLTLVPETVTGTYAIDPDSEGGNDPFDVHCDMDFDGGGWTQVAFEDFESPTSGWSTTNTITSCGTYGNILGGYKTISTATNSKTYGLLDVPHTHVRLNLDYIKIDSWDNENAVVHLGGQQIYSHTFCFCSQGCQNGGGTCGGSAICGGGWDEEHTIEVTGTIAHTGNSVVVYGDSSIDQDPADESWGFDNILLNVR